jgi:hypothetical protein
MKKFLLCIMLLSIASPAGAHRGRTNSEGCHNNRKTGDYHCHNGGNSGAKAARKASKPKAAVRAAINHNCQTLLASNKGAWVFAGENLKSKVLVKLPSGTKLVMSGKQNDKSPFFKMQPVGQKTVGFVHKSVVYCP